MEKSAWSLVQQNYTRFQVLCHRSLGSVKTFMSEQNGENLKQSSSLFTSKFRFGHLSGFKVLLNYF